MPDRNEEVMVGSVRCHVVQREGMRLLVRPVPEAGRSLNVSRWIDESEAAAIAPPPLVLSQDEIRKLAMVLRDVFYEDAEPRPVAR